MDGQAISPPQGLSETQAVELLKQRRAAAKQQPAPQAVEAPTDEAETLPAETPSNENEAEVDAEAPEGDVDAKSDDSVEEPVIRFVVDGKPQTASLKEAQEALASVKHLSRLRNEIVENHRNTQAEFKEVQTQRQTVVQHLQEVEHLLSSGLPKQADMQRMLDAGDTAGYLKAQQAHQKFAQVHAFRQQQSQQLQQQEEAARKNREAQEAEELVKARPDFKKPEYTRQVVNFLKSEWGFDDTFIAALGARELQIVDDARKWNEWNRNKSLGVKKAIEKSASPSRAPLQTNVGNKQFTAMRETVRQGGGMNDAINLMKMKRQLKG